VEVIDLGIQHCQTSPKLKGKTLSPLINTDDTDREIAVQFSIFGTFGDFSNLL
jgi:hypothetical protein